MRVDDLLDREVRDEDRRDVALADGEARPGERVRSILREPRRDAALAVRVPEGLHGDRLVERPEAHRAAQMLALPAALLALGLKGCLQPLALRRGCFRCVGHLTRNVRGAVLCWLAFGRSVIARNPHARWKQYNNNKN